MADFLDTWTWMNPLPQGNTLNDAVYADGKLVAVGDHGTVIYSSDLVNWNVKKLVVESDLNGIAYGNGVFVAVGGNGAILTSTDADTWTPVVDFGTANALNKIAFGFNWFFAVGNVGTILGSHDGGITWSNAISGETGDLAGIAYAEYPGISHAFVATVKNTNRIVWWNGASWLPRTVADSTYSSLNCITGFMDTFVMSDRNNVMLANISDLSSWAVHPLPTTDSITLLSKMFSLNIAATYNDGLFVSNNLTDWTPAGVSGIPFFGLAYYRSNSMAVVGEYGNIYWSDGGLTWTPASTGNAKSLADICFGGGQYLAVGYEGTVMLSSDGSRWTQPSPDIPYNLLACTYGVGNGSGGIGRFVAVAGSSAFYSNDGIQWMPCNFSDIDLDLTGVAYGAGKFTAAGGHLNIGGIFTSNDVLTGKWSLSYPITFTGYPSAAINLYLEELWENYILRMMD